MQLCTDVFILFFILLVLRYNMGSHTSYIDSFAFQGVRGLWV